MSGWLSWRVAVAGLWMLSISTPVHAQHDDAHDAARARFAEGVHDAEEGRWGPALVAFEEAYARWPQPIILFNLAGALAQNGRLREAADAYRRVEADATDAALAREAARERASVEARLAYVDVRAENAAAGDLLVIDGEVLGAHASYRRVPVDPGAHRVELRRDERAIASEAITLDEAETREVRLVVVLELPRAETMAAPRPWWEEPAPWVVLGVVIVGVAVAVPVGLELSRPPPPFRGDLPSVVAP